MLDQTFRLCLCSFESSSIHSSHRKAKTYDSQNEDNYDTSSGLATETGTSVEEIFKNTLSVVRYSSRKVSVQLDVNGDTGRKQLLDVLMNEIAPPIMNNPMTEKRIERLSDFLPSDLTVQVAESRPEVPHRAILVCAFVRTDCLRS